jgi:hypothetical protein
LAESEAAGTALRPGRYLLRAGLALLALWLLMAAWTLVSDPFGLFKLVESQGFNQAKSNNVRLQEALSFRRHEPAVVVLGSSRVSAFRVPLRQRFDDTMTYQVPDVRCAELAGLLDYIRRTAPPRRLYLGLDFFAFNRASGIVAPQYARLDALFWPDYLLRNLLSWDAFREGIRVVARSGDGAAVAKQAGIQADRAEADAGSEAPGKAEARFRDVVAQYLKPHFYGAFRFDAAGAARLEAAIRRLAASGTEVVLFIGPPHVALLATLKASGTWPAFAAFQRHYAAFAEGSGLTLWNFVAVDALSGEAIGPGMHWYRDPSHYLGETARLLLARMAGDEAAVPIGARFPGGDVEALLARQAADLDAYLAAHPALARLVEGAAAEAGVALAVPLRP